MDLHNKNWQTISINETLLKLESSRNGLDDTLVQKRRDQFGLNELTQKKKRTAFHIFIEQFKDVMILILIVAGLLSFVFGIIKAISRLKDWQTEIAEGSVIIFIVLLNAVIGMVQEIKASNALDALKKISAPTSRVIRNGITIVVPSNEIVLGDVVYIEDGSIVPADLRLIESNNLKIQEASLTGESVPVQKHANMVFDEKTPIGDQKNMCFSSSIVTYGNGIGVVVNIGMYTEVGKIAKMLNEQVATESPIKKKLNKVGKILSIIGAIAAVVVLSIGFATLKEWNQFKWLEPLMTAIALAVAVIPEGLPATATIVMALGVQRMAKKNAIVRRLPVVETLGSATVVCSDKTGTLTLNKMTVTQIADADDVLQLKTVDIAFASKSTNKLYKQIVKCAVLCNNAEINEEHPELTMGDPTEGALLNLGINFEINYKSFRKEYPRILEQPFDSVRKRMSSLHKNRDEEILFTKGAAEELLDKCKFIQTNNGVREITTDDKKAVNKVIAQMSEKALRVLGYALTIIKNRDEKISDLENDMTFIGLTGMIDPPRKEVIDAINVCHIAGIKTIMITGDHKVTARVIATELGIFKPNDRVIDGNELDRMSDQDLKQAVKNTTVFARVSPTAKLRIVKALQANHEIAAMTGDGVNDAPALKAADIGVAMGITGTDVAKDASDMILLDDNFTTIEGAIFEGRRIYRNIQKVIQLLIAGNVAEILIVLTVFIASAISTHFDEVLNPIQLLCINLITDTIPCFALGLDPAEKNIMKQKARDPNVLFEKGLVYRIIFHGFYLYLISLVGYCLGDFVFSQNGWIGGESKYDGMTMAFLVISISQVFHSFNQQSDSISIFSKENQFNKLLPLLSGVAFVIVIILAMISMYGNATKVLGMNQMSYQCWLAMLALSISIIPAVELSKVFIRIHQKSKMKVNV